MDNDANSRDAAWCPRFNPYLIAASVMLATFMEVLDTSVANVSLPHIAGGLSATNDQATWVLTSYLVATADSTQAIFFAFFINASILVLSAAAFHGTEHQDVADISDAYKLLESRSRLCAGQHGFCNRLFASGQNSTVTGTLAG